MQRGDVQQALQHGAAVAEVAWVVQARGLASGCEIPWEFDRSAPARGRLRDAAGGGAVLGRRLRRRRPGARSRRRARRRRRVPGRRLRLGDARDVPRAEVAAPPAGERAELDLVHGRGEEESEGELFGVQGQLAHFSEGLEGRGHGEDCSRHCEDGVVRGDGGGGVSGGDWCCFGEGARVLDGRGGSARVFLAVDMGLIAGR